MEQPEAVVQNTGYFMAIAAMDALSQKFGPEFANWPRHNRWQAISTEMMTITQEDLPNLMVRYKVDILIDFERYFGNIPEENNYEP